MGFPSPSQVPPKRNLKPRCAPLFAGASLVTLNSWVELREAAKRTLMPIDPSECRQHALDCVRLAQTATTPEARKIWSDLAKTWLMFASDLEANERLSDEWGRPKPKKHQTE
jgi:hypothetical protein